VGEGTGDEALAGAGGAGDEHLLVLVDPAARGELADHGLVEFPAGGIVDGLDAGAVAEWLERRGRTATKKKE
jgi:hypothetical protein